MNQIEICHFFHKDFSQQKAKCRSTKRAVANIFNISNNRKLMCKHHKAKVQVVLGKCQERMYQDLCQLQL